MSKAPTHEGGSRRHNLLVVVPEYRTAQAQGGGVNAVAEFALGALGDRSEWRSVVASLRMWHRAPESRRLLDPKTWLRRPEAREVEGTSPRVFNVGASLAELETSRYLPRKALFSLARNADVALVVCGTPAVGCALLGSSVPKVLQVATFARLERKAILARDRPLRRLIRGAMTAVTGLLDEIGLRTADIVLVENEEMLAACKARGIRDARLIPPGVDTSIFRPATSEPRSGYLLTVSRLNDPRKDLPTLFRAYATARSDYGVQQRLVLAGMHGPSDSDLLLLRRLGLQEHVEIRIGLTQSELVATYQNAALFVLSSREEGLGIAILEALACGVPVVATATFGANFVLAESGAGQLVQFGDDGNTTVQSLARAIATWANDDLMLANAQEPAREHVEANFSSETAGASFREVLHEVSRS